MRKALLPILAILLLVLTGTWGVHVLGGFGTRARDPAGPEDDWVGLVRDLPGTEGDGEDVAGTPGSATGADLRREGTSKDGERGRTTGAGLTGRPPDPAAVEDAPWIPGTPAETTPVERTSVARDELLIGSGSSSVDEEVLVPPVMAWLGTPEPWAAQVAEDLGPPGGAAILREVPRHAFPFPEGVWIERYEVTEERYRTFLEQTSLRKFTTPLGEATNLLETISELFTEPTPVASDRADIAARQLYRANRAALDLALGVTPGEIDAADATADERLWKRVREARLPAGVTLRFYDRAPPHHWPSERYPAGRALYPARGLSFEAANAMAMWAGKHLPSEVTWEFAARGPHGWDYPWGNKPALFATHVNGGMPRERDEEPETFPITSLPEGASWLGCQHMLGNVAEWTRAWPLPYPVEEGTAFQGGTARGGSAANVTRVAIRPAQRGYMLDHGLPEGAPHPSRAWKGARLARFREPARSIAYGMQVEVQLPGWLHVDSAVVEPRVYAGTEGKLEGRIFVPRQDASVRMGAKAFVVQPLAYVSHEWKRQSLLRQYLAGVPEHVIDLESLVALSDGPPVLLGIFHTGIRLLDSYEVRAKDLLRRGRVRLDPAATPPGSWWLCLWRGYLVLWAPQRVGNDPYDLVGPRWRVLTHRPVTAATVNVSARRTTGDQLPRTKAELKLSETGQVNCEIESRLGNPAHPDLIVRVRFRVQAELDVVRRVSDWEYGTVIK